ncbi:dimethyladenosine transferase [Mariniphaga anaerophila]|uniref:Ribosomal RNA small subunit methyltransferase A n=1 Tax=Mariniphaga anaerophila TaxID=1484053 RepID=A0A1M5FVG4_9BACT|nr:16S rRNA (adenine(1518)-N(6)/adenine(1519)-N(6))-dimethyltransferase RsmA [Mariniphaga anaerophila]SHF95439.1 dimethyladenosine transferase [Mariniphaga anaerophila]
MSVVRPKKKLGQHFLKDQNIAFKIVDSLGVAAANVLEVGPGMGVLTRYLLQRPELSVHVVEIDPESVEYLKTHFPGLEPRIYSLDFLKWDAAQLPQHFSVIGNFPYNISSQIFFRIIEWRNRVPEVVCMVQKEVAERLSSPPGNKTYGILSVLLGAFYDTEYLFTVSEQVFIPPPKVKSAVIRLRRNSTEELPCNEELFFKIVKAAFNKRRKMLRNSLSEQGLELPEQFATKRPEQLSVADFIRLTKMVET